MNKEKIVDKFMSSKMPITTSMDNGLFKTKLYNFIEWLESEQLLLCEVVRQSEQLSCETCKFNCDYWDDNHPCANCAGFEFWEAT